MTTMLMASSSPERRAGCAPLRRTAGTPQFGPEQTSLAKQRMAMKAISWQASMLAGFRFRADARHACGSRAKAAIGEMHRILDAIRKRDRSEERRVGKECRARRPP